ncbi:MAG: glycosyltransferase family 4 protein [Paludibacteraceae bacterium]|nr:glycosyltransferase family 4 protein [Paludibacteraceae bacterium]
MNILHIHPSLAGGGIEAMICGLANEMAEQGHKVTVCSIFQPKSTDVFWGKIKENVSRSSLGKKNKGFSLSIVFKIFKYIRNGNFDIVQLHGFFYYYMLAVFFFRKSKYFYTLHNDAYQESNSWDKRFFFLKKFAIRRGWIHPITISEESKNSFEKLYGCASCLCPNGIPKPIITYGLDIVDKERRTPETRVFLSPVRIAPQKNLPVLVKVFSRLIKEGHDVVILIVGSVQDESIFSTIKPYFTERIKYLGEFSEVPSLLYSADGLCLPSLWEGLPVVLLEALSVGCVPICTPVGGVVNVIEDGYNGLLADSPSEEDYYKVMSKFLSMSKETVSVMKGNCLESFGPYDIKRVVADYMRYYESI